MSNPEKIDDCRYRYPVSSYDRYLSQIYTQKPTLEQTRDGVVLGHFDFRTLDTGYPHTVYSKGYPYVTQVLIKTLIIIHVEIRFFNSIVYHRTCLSQVYPSGRGDRLCFPDRKLLLSSINSRPFFLLGQTFESLS